MVIKQNTVNLQCDKGEGGGVAHGTQSEQNKKEERRSQVLEKFEEEERRRRSQGQTMTPVPMSDLSDLENANKKKKEYAKKKKEEKKKRKKATKSGFELATCIFSRFFPNHFFPLFFPLTNC